MSWQLASFGLLALALAAGFAWYERSRPSSRTVALVAALAALATLGRLAFAPLPNVKPTTDIVLIAGYVLGGAPGFTVGAVSAIASNIVLSEGPWTPWQMLAWGLVGIAGAVLARCRRPIPRLPMALICGPRAVSATGSSSTSTPGSATAAIRSRQYLVVEGSAFRSTSRTPSATCFFYLAFGPALMRALRRFRGAHGRHLGRVGVAVGDADPRSGGGAERGPRGRAGGAWRARRAGAARDPAAACVGYLVAAENRDGGFGLAPGQSVVPGGDRVGGDRARRGARAARGGRARGGPGCAGIWASSRVPGDVERTVLALAAARAPLGALVPRLERAVGRDGSVVRAGEPDRVRDPRAARRRPPRRAARAPSARGSRASRARTAASASPPPAIPPTSTTPPGRSRRSSRRRRRRRRSNARGATCSPMRTGDGGFPLEPGEGLERAVDGLGRAGAARERRRRGTRAAASPTCARASGASGAGRATPPARCRRRSG